MSQQNKSSIINQGYKDDSIIDNPFNIGDSTTEVSWKYFFYKLWIVTKTPFTNPNKQPKKADVDLMEQVRYIVTTDPTKKQNVSLCKDYIGMHRINENTKARKRLEKWARRLISIYLTIVLFLIIASSVNWDFLSNFSISETIMITILSTTTINVIGLALIVMRGHFPQIEKSKYESRETLDENPSTDTNPS